MKYFRTYHLPISPGATSDDKISDDVSTILGKRIVMTEKLDGSNSALTNQSVFARSHGAESRNPWDNVIWELQARIRAYLSDDVYLFGENMYAIHSIEYTKLDAYFYLFGVRDNGVFLSFKDVLEYSFLLDIPTVPVLFDGTINTEKELNELVLDLFHNTNTLGAFDSNGIEGIVVRAYDSFHQDESSKNVFKYVRANHVTTDTHWTRNWKVAKINYK